MKFEKMRLRGDRSILIKLISEVYGIEHVPMNSNLSGFCNKLVIGERFSSVIVFF